MGSETCGELTRSELNKEQNQLKPLLELWILVHKRLTFFSHYLHKTLTISETSNPVQSWHFDDKSEQVVNEGIKRLVSHHAPRKVSYWLQFIVDEKLRRHHNKTYTNIQQKISLLFTNKSVKMILVLRCDQSNRATWKYQLRNAFEWYTVEYPTSHLYFLVYAKAFRWVFIPGKYKWRVGYSGHGRTVDLMTRLQRNDIFLWAGGNGCQGHICILRIAQELACNGGWGLAWHEGLFWWHSHCGCRYCSPHWKLTELDACMKKVLLWYFTWTHQMSKESHTTC